MIVCGTRIVDWVRIKSSQSRYGHESFSELCLVDFVERTWLSVRLLDISTSDKEMWVPVRPAIYTSYFSPPAADSS